MNTPFIHSFNKYILLLLSHFSRVRLCVTPWTAAYPAPPSMGFSGQQYWRGVPLPSPNASMLKLGTSDDFSSCFQNCLDSKSPAGEPSSCGLLKVGRCVSMSSCISLLMCLEHVVTWMHPLQVVCLCVLCCTSLCRVQQCRIFISSPGCPKLVKWWQDDTQNDTSWYIAFFCLW